METTSEAPAEAETGFRTIRVSERSHRRLRLLAAMADVSMLDAYEQFGAPGIEDEIHRREALARAAEGAVMSNEMEG